MDREKISIRCKHIITTFLLMGMLLFLTNEMNVCAKEDDFDIEAVLLPANEETYDIRIGITNNEKDWEGTVRVMYDESYGTTSAYDTIISLPEGSTKQFDVKIAMSSIEEVNSTLIIVLYDKKMKECAREEFPRFFFQGEESLSLGILSDNYDDLTCMDLGGETFFFYGAGYPIGLQKLTQDNILEYLDTLEFLVIDTYDTSVLTQEVLTAIEEWNSEGGVLVIGTGAYADKTLALFEDSYLEIEVKDCYEPKTAPVYEALDFADWSQLTMAEFWSSPDYYEEYPFQLLNRPFDDGSIGVLPFALSEVVNKDQSFYKSTDRQGFLIHMLEVISSNSNRRYNTINLQNKYNIDQISWILRIISKVNNNLNFSALKIIVIVYVIFVGPVLYLILRALKKREWYWIAVPTTTILGVFIIFLVGRGLEVKDTQVYSVTMQDMTGERSQKSYLYCFDAGNKEWGLRLKGNYDYVTPFNSYNYRNTRKDYYYHFTKEGDSHTIGLNPTVNFDEAFFILHKQDDAKSVEGTIEVAIDPDTISSVMRGRITNATEEDFKYFAVLMGESMYVYEGLKAGETCELAKQECLFGSFHFDIWSDYMREVRNIRNKESAETISELSALGVGIANICYNEGLTMNSINDSIVVIGVIADWENVIDDECTERSYGCVYVIE